MKFSRYNNFIPFEGKFIAHNGVTGSYLILENDIVEWINNAEKTKNIAEIEDLHPDLYYTLLREGFIIDDNIDELQKVINSLKDLDSDSTKYELHINPTMNCNFKCWYCYENHVKNYRMKPETIEKVLKLVGNIIQENNSLKELQLNWFGGEPMLYFDDVIYPILREVNLITNKKNIEFNNLFTTNGLLITDDIIKKLCKFNVESFQITLDGYDQVHDKVRFISKTKGSYHKIVENIKKLIRSNILVSVRINCSDWSFDGIENIACDFMDLKDNERQFLIFDFHEVWQNENDISSLISEKVRVFKEFGFNAVSRKIRSYMASLCYADRVNNANINYNGDVYKCTARDYNEKNKEGVLNSDGTITWNYKRDIRLNSKYKNRPCMECTIFPLCTGGCSQNALESDGKDYCIYDYDEDKKKKLILDNFLSLI